MHQKLFTSQVTRLPTSFTALHSQKNGISTLLRGKNASPAFEMLPFLHGTVGELHKVFFPKHKN